MNPLTVGQLYDRAVANGGDRIAITDGNRQISYAELGKQAARLVGAFAGLSIGRGERIAFLMANCAEYVACEYAVAKLGATRVPLAVLLGEEDHIYMINFACCKVLVYHAKLQARVLAMQPRLETVEHFIRVGSGEAALPPGHFSLENLLSSGSPTQGATDIDPEEIAGIYFTGGTTGKPKGVMLSHRSWFYTYFMEMLDFGIGPRETFVFATPMTHAGGCLILPVLLRQGRCVVLDRFEPNLLLSVIERERATATLLIPTMIYVLLDYPQRSEYDCSSLRNILYGASAIAPERLKQALQVFGPVFTQFFGQTEAPMALVALQREDHTVANPEREQVVLTSAGRPTYATEIRLVDETGRDVPSGEAGEVVARAPNMMSGYLNDPEATAYAIRDGWLYTGDIARFDDEGLITIVDRKKDMIVSGGFNIYPREVEDVLFEHPAVRQAAVIGIPHEKWGEEVKALVVLQPGATTGERELLDFVKTRKGSVMTPKSIDFVDAIPLTNLGKMDKKAMRARYWDGRTRNV
ncbi:MAG: AMP-binding protein [Zoogloeaceae bacterium]|nr:AMP-binding protein [Zoogloeaceae bacterium]